MGMIKIVTDSTADLSLEVAQKYGITVVPLGVQFGTERYRDRVNLSSQEFFAKLQSTQVLPMTSQPSPGEFIQAYEALAKEAKAIISIHLTSSFSGTCHVAELAKESMPNVDIEVIDSQSLSIGMGFMVIAAAKAALEGKSKAEIIALVRKMITKMDILCTVDTVEYLKRSGRVQKFQAMLGSLLNIKPIMEIRHGVINLVDKVRGRTRSLQRLVELMEERIDSSKKLNVAIMHGQAADDADRLKRLIKEKFFLNQFFCSDLGPVIGTHGGPGVIGVVFYEAEEGEF